MTEKKPVNLANYRKQKAVESRHTATKQQLSEAIERIQQLEADLALVKRLKGGRKVRPIVASKPGHSEAVAVAVATDWHIGKAVDPSQVNGLNQYSVAIARQRSRQFFERVVRLTNKERQDVDIDHLILLLNGDLIDGALHLDTIMADEVSEVFKQALIAQECIEAGLEYIEREGNFKQVTLVCSDGN